MERHLDIRTETKEGSKERSFTVKKVLCAGFAGRNREKVYEHINELAEMGVPEPKAIPTIYRVGVKTLTNEKSLEVQGDNTSGEVEFVALFDEDRILITVGSDHTDRDLETLNIEKAKQINEKILPLVFWPFDEMKDHWDSIILRAWINENGKRALYQEGTLESILPLETLRETVARRTGEELDGTVLFSGTIPAAGGLRPSDHFWMQIEDPVLNRSIEHDYSVTAIRGSY